MRYRYVLVLIPAIASAALAGTEESIDDGVGVLVDSRGSGCGDLLIHADGTYENGYAWGYGGTFTPDIGAWAECYSGPVKLCAMVTDLTRTDTQSGRTMDVFVWDDDKGLPGPVLIVQSEVNPGPVALWPSVSRHAVSLETECLAERFHVGWWGAWPDGPPDWFIAADTDGPGGCPSTNVAPGLGFPSGWQHVDMVWPGTHAIGIGIETVECATPTLESSWGRIKSLFE